MIRRLSIVALLLAAGGLLCFLLLRKGSPASQGLIPAAETSSPPEEQLPQSTAVAPATNAVDSPGASVPNSAAAPSTFPPKAVAAATPFLLGSADAAPPMEPATVLDNMRIAIRNYGSRFGGNPVGTNPEITRALNGGNPKQVKFLNEEAGMRINARGELVDYWGTPFFFHQLSASVMEIHSAGPDRIMWTADDLVTK